MRLKPLVTTVTDVLSRQWWLLVTWLEVLQKILTMVVVMVVVMVMMTKMMAIFVSWWGLMNGTNVITDPSGLCSHGWQLAKWQAADIILFSCPTIRGSGVEAMRIFFVKNDTFQTLRAMLWNIVCNVLGV